MKVDTKGNFKRGTESFLIAANNNVITTNYVKAEIDNAQQDPKCKICGENVETINHIITECSKLAEKDYKTRPTGWEK